MRKFFDEIEVDNLPLHATQDKRSPVKWLFLAFPSQSYWTPKAARCPMRGDATWNSDNAKDIIATLISDDPQG